MKKRIIIVTLLAVLTTINLISCNNIRTEKRKIAKISNYQILNYQAAGVSGGTEGDLMIKNLYAMENYKKENVEKRRVSVFGEEYVVHYAMSHNIFRRGHSVDRYEGGDDGTYIAFWFDEKTDKLIKYKYDTAEPYDAVTFKEPINENSTEKDYADYARSLILEYTGLDTRDMKYDVKTSAIETKHEYSDEDIKADFKNFIKDDPDFKAEYTFTFYKTISGLKRGDNVEAVIRNDGTVLGFSGEVYDDAFDPFSDLSFDAEALFNAVDSSYSSPGEEVYHKTSLVAIPAADGLWIDAEINGVYFDDDGFPQWDHVKYAIKIAEYID